MRVVFIFRTMLIFCFAWLFAAAAIDGPPDGGTLLDEGYAAMYNLDFATAHRDFQNWERAHPADPMGPVSDAAAHLFSEFDRLHVLESEFFIDDTSFTAREHNLQADPAAKAAFESALNQSQRLAADVLAHAPNDENAMLASVLAGGLRADYLALIEKRNLAGLSEMKQSRAVAERLVKIHPDCYDAYLAMGVENYMLSIKPAPVRWILRLGGAETDKQAGIQHLKLTAEKGHYLLPYARLLLAVAALRDHDLRTARENLAWLAEKYPGNRLYRAELVKLK